MEQIGVCSRLKPKKSIHKGGVPMIITIISLIIGIPGAIWAIIQIVTYYKNKDRHDGSIVH